MLDTRWKGDWMLTVRQAIPQLRPLLRQMQPTFELPGTNLIDERFLAGEQIEGVIWDVDGTLMRHHHRATVSGPSASILALLRSCEVRHVILSNCGEARYLDLGRIFPGVPVLRGYSSPEGVVFRRLLHGEDVWFRGKDRVPPVAAARLLRKPNTHLVRYALREIGLPAERVLAVGDQYLTDIAPANACGVRSAKVPTLEKHSFPLSVRVLQRIETVVYNVLYLRPGGAHLQ